MSAVAGRAAAAAAARERAAAALAEAHAASSDEESDEPECRICRLGAGNGLGPLYHPCACSGSIRYVHQECLQRWLAHSGARSCEVCKTEFRFSPVYADNAPRTLPTGELVAGIARRGMRAVCAGTRLGAVAATWAGAVPLGTACVWRLSTTASPASAASAIIERLSDPGAVVADCVFGSALSATIVLLLLGVASLREYVRLLREREGAHGANEPHVAAAHAVHPDALQPAGGGAGGGGGAGAGVGPGPGAVDADQDDPEDVPFDQLVGLRGPWRTLLSAAATVLASNACAMGLFLFIPMQLGRALLMVLAGGVAAARAVASGAGGEHVAIAALQASQAPDPSVLVMRALVEGAHRTLILAPEGYVPAALEARLRESVDDVDAAEGGGDEPALSSAATLVLGYAVVFFLATAWIVLLRGVVRRANAQLEWRGAPVAEHRPHAEGDRGDNAAHGGGNQDALSGDGPAPGTHMERAQRHIGDNADARAPRWNPHALDTGDGTGAHRGAGAHEGAVATEQGIAGENPPHAAREGGQPQDADLHADAALLMYLMQILRYGGTLLKVTVLLVMELGLFPLMCGWWVDFCTLPLLGATLAERFEFWSSSPVTSTNVHWLVGIAFMLNMSIFVALLREVLRPGVLSFLRDPADPNYNPFRDLVEDSVSKHLRRVVVSGAIYGTLTVLLVYLPIQLALALAPSLFPVQLRFSDPFAEVPVDMLLFHLVVPFTAEHVRPRRALRRLFSEWVTWAATAFGVDAQLLPDVPVHVGGDPNGEDGGGVDVPLERAEGWQLNGRQADLLNGDAAEGMERVSTPSPRPSHYGVRIAGICVVGWLSLVACMTATLLVPLATGKSLCACLRLPVAHDAYAFGIGSYALWGACAAARRGRWLLARSAPRETAAVVARCAVQFALATVLLFMWGVVIPLLVGTIFELFVLVPLRVAIDETPLLMPYQDWVLGILALKVWTRLVFLGLDVPQLLGGDEWRVRFEAVRRDGLANLRPAYVMRHVIWPFFCLLLTVLTFPYVCAKVVVGPVVGAYVGAGGERACVRYAWAASAAAGMGWLACRGALAWFSELHASIFDEVRACGPLSSRAGVYSRVCERPCVRVGRPDNADALICRFSPSPHTPRECSATSSGKNCTTATTANLTTVTTPKMQRASLVISPLPHASRLATVLAATLRAIARTTSMTAATAIPWPPTSPKCSPTCQRTRTSSVSSPPSTRCSSLRTWDTCGASRTPTARACKLAEGSEACTSVKYYLFIRPSAAWRLRCPVALVARPHRRGGRRRLGARAATT